MILTAETRYIATPEIRVDSSDPSKLVFSGKAVVYRSPSEPICDFVEEILPGCFAGLATSDVRCLVDHNPSLILGRNASKTLLLDDRADALYAQCNAARTYYAEALAMSIGRGDVSGMSFRFYTIEDRWEQPPGGTLKRSVIRATIDDVSFVTYPAYTATTAGVRSLSDADTAAARTSLAAYRSRPAEEGRAEDGRRRLRLFDQMLRSDAPTTSPR